jgi:hypothetical protein
MKVFIGWSGETSHKVALALAAWLPKVIQAVKPFVSSEDIAKGARWSAVIGTELQSSNYGIICITRDNLTSLWVNFEAGALSRDLDKGFVTPFLFDVKTSDIDGPLSQFQATTNDKDDIFKLLVSINGKQGDERLEKGALEDAFEMRWGALKNQLAEIEREGKGKPAVPKRSTEDKIEEILELVRTMQRAEFDTAHALTEAFHREKQRAIDEQTNLLEELRVSLARGPSRAKKSLRDGLTGPLKPPPK